MCVPAFARRFAPVVSTLLVLVFPYTAASAPTVRVRAGTTIDLVVSETETGSTVIRGQISDDAGATLGHVAIRIEATSQGHPVGLEAPAGCDGQRGSAPSLDRGAYVVTADDRGDFCVRRPSTSNGLVFHARFVGNNFFDGSEQAAEPVPESERRTRTVLRFESPPTEIDLERPETTFVVALKVDRADADRLPGPVKREGVSVTLSDEEGHEIATSTTGGDGRARFAVASDKAGAPGNGELRARFAGDSVLAPASAFAPVIRSAVVQLSVTQPERGEPEKGIALAVEATSAHGTVDGGIVQAFVGADAVGTAPVEKGKAKLVVTFVSGQRIDVPVTVQFVPAAPWWRPGKPADISVAVAGPSVWRHVVLGLLVAALTAWIVAKWRRAPQPARGESTSLMPPSGRPEILVVDRPSGLRGWRGTVTDAHEGYPVSNAILRVVLPGFEDHKVLAETTSDAVGSFAIEVDRAEGARLLVEGDLHATYEQVLPPPSVIRVALITRRRALLDRLVRWAKMRGGAYDSSKEPTPGHVRRVASRAHAGEVEAWARKLEHTAYGADAVTREIEAEVREIEPRAAHPAPEQRPDALR